MKKTVLILLSVCLPAIFQAQAQWKLTSGPWGDAPSILAVASNGDLIAARTNLIFRSTDGGANWTRLQVPKNLGNYAELVTLPGAKIIAHIGSSIYRMDVDGANFTKLNFTNVRNILADRYGALYAVHPDVTVSKSTNAGDIWTAVTGPAGQNINDFATDGDIYYGTTYTGIMISSDRGASWKRALNGLSSAAYYAINAGENGNVWAMSDGASYWSGDAGAHWHATNPQLDFHYRVVPGSGDQAMFNGQFLNGDTITSAKAPGGGPFVLDSSRRWLCAVASGSDNLFFASPPNWNWKPISLPLATASYVIRAYNTVFAGFYSKEYLLNNADGWEKFCDCSPVPTTMNYVDGSLLSVGNGVLYRSLDFGRNWKNILSDAIPKSMVVTVAIRPHRIYAGTQGLYYTDDTGYTWNETNDSRFTGNISALCADSAGHLFAASLSGLFVSSDKGDSWTRLNGPSRTIKSLLANNKGTLVAICSGDTVYSSTDAGSNWQKGVTTDQSSIFDAVLSDSNDIFVSTSTGIYAAQPWSKSLVNISAGLDSASLTDSSNILALDGAGELFVSTAGRGIWKLVGAPPRSIVATQERPVDVSIFPNPVRSTLHIAGHAITRISIFDPLGVVQKRFEYNVPTSSDELLLSELPAGTYLVRIESFDGNSVTRFVKE